MFTEHLAYEQTPERTAAILMDEASSVHKGLLYREVFPHDSGWYSLNCKVEAGDLLIMLKLLCEQCGWSLEELEIIGKERFMVRMSELKKGRRE